MAGPVGGNGYGIRTARAGLAGRQDWITATVFRAGASITQAPSAGWPVECLDSAGAV